MKYIVEQLGDISGLDGFGSFDEALEFVGEITKDDSPNGHSTDPEDNRILIWEVSDSEHKKVVWHFSGWHWDADEFGLPQGKLKGHEKSLYEESIY